MGLDSAKIVDITRRSEYEERLYRCLTGPVRRYKKRVKYLERAIPRGFHKKLLILEGEVVGQIEYAPADVSYYPISGDGVVAMNCIWVLRKAGGHEFGKLLLNDMIRDEEDAVGFATIGLENHWSPWFLKGQMEYLGFQSSDSMMVRHKMKHQGEAFRIHFMWMPRREDAEAPTWNRERLLEGITYCTAHPLYHPQTYKPKQIFEISYSSID